MEKPTILIADDDFSVLELFREVFEKEGYHTIATTNGKEAVFQASSNAVDVALLDLRMPYIDGIEALRLIKGIDSSVEVIIITAYSDAESLNRILENGAFDYLMKPAPIYEIKNTVKNALLKRKLTLENQRAKKELLERVQQLMDQYEDKTHALRKSQVKYKEIIENSNDAIIIVSNDQVLFFNPMAKNILGFTSEELLKMRWHELIYREDFDVCLRKAGAGEASLTSFRLLTKDKKAVWMESNSVETIWEGRPATLYFLRDIQERKIMEDRLKETEARYESLFNRSLFCVFLFDAEGNFLDANDSTIRITGYERKELLKLNILDLVFDDDHTFIRDFLTGLQKLKDQSCFLEVRWTPKNGEVIWMEMELSIASFHRGSFTIHGIAREITERKNAEERLKYLSTHDPLTGLYNRAYFDEELYRLERGRTFPISVIIADLDGLKAINDQLGHPSGDEAIKTAAYILRSSCRAEDVVARIGGDEFGILLPGSDEKIASKVIFRIQENLERERQSKEGISIHMSLGAATAHKGGQLKEALKEADRSMYRNKSNCTPKVSSIL